MTADMHVCCTGSQAGYLGTQLHVNYDEDIINTRVLTKQQLDHHTTQERSPETDHYNLTDFLTGVQNPSPQLTLALASNIHLVQCLAADMFCSLGPAAV